jgi:hypothetical protein
MLAAVEVLLNKIGAAATKLKVRLDMIYAVRHDCHDRTLSGLHDTVLPLCSSARSIFQQLRSSTAKKSKKPKPSAAAVSAGEEEAGVSQKLITGRPNGRITGVDMRHLLLLLPFLLFDLMHEEIREYNTSNHASIENPAHALITVVLTLLEWYHLYR